jgi:hypothetical protein
MLRLADRYDRPVLYDEVNGELYVVESSMLFRCVLEVPAAVPVPGLAIVRDLVPQPVEEPEPEAVPEPAPAMVDVPPAATAPPSRDIRPAVPREQRHRWPSRREYGGRRKPSPQGRDWVYATQK